MRGEAAKEGGHQWYGKMMWQNPCNFRGWHRTIGATECGNQSKIESNTCMQILFFLMINLEMTGKIYTNPLVTGFTVIPECYFKP